MTRRIPAEEVADEIWILLDDSKEKPLTRKTLARQTGFTDSQINNGIDLINHRYQLQKKQPVAYIGGYVLPEYFADCLTYQINRKKDLVTRGRTELVREMAKQERWPDQADKQAIKQWNRWLEDTEDLLTEMMKQKAEIEQAKAS